MRVLVQRSKNSMVKVAGKQKGKIAYGLVVLVGFTNDDTIDDIKYLARKIVNLRIFDDDNGIMNKSLLDVKGQILSISQFTLYAELKKGNRPSYIKALASDKANDLYNLFNAELKSYGIIVETGVFGADMLVSINNDGPVTIFLESRNENDKKR